MVETQTDKKAPMRTDANSDPNFWSGFAKKYEKLEMPFF